MSYTAHRHKALEAVHCAVLTVSDSRVPETDETGRQMIRLLRDRGHAVLAYAVIRDDAGGIRTRLEDLTADEKLQAVILSGGTGLSRRDVTFEAVEALLEKRLVGFGELFRYLSYLEIGPAAILSRATAGVYRGKLIFALPGSTAAVRLALEKIILPELGHMVWDAAR